MSNTLDIGIVGAGGIVAAVHLPVISNIPDARIAWIGDINPQSATELGRAFGVPAASLNPEDPRPPPCDVALLATPVHGREPYLRYFAHQGIAVLSEKPFAVTEGQHQEFLDLFGNTPIACGYMRRTYASIVALRQMVQQAGFGKLLSIRYAEGGRVSSSEFASSTLDLSHRQGGGVLRDLGCHGIDAIFFITGATHFHVIEAQIAWDDDTDREVSARFELTIGSGPIPVDFCVSWITRQTNCITLEFESATVECGLSPAGEWTIRDRKGASIPLSLDHRGARTAYQAFFLEWRDFLQALPLGNGGTFDASGCLPTTRLVDEIYRSGGTAV